MERLNIITTMVTKYIQNTFEKSFDSNVEETRKVQFVISTDSRDRHNEVINMKNWKLDTFNANPIVGYQHNVYGDNMCLAPNPDDVLGKSKAWIDQYKGKTALLAEVEFEPKEINPLAEKVFRKVLFGSLNAASVGILPIGKGKVEKTTKDSGDVEQTYYYDGQELIEWSIVNIPANPDARAKSMKNHTLSALQFVQRVLPEFSMKDLKTMRVNEILDLIERKTAGEDIAQLEIDLREAQEKYNERLNSILNNYKHLIK
jgi:hypothetical protein